MKTAYIYLEEKGDEEKINQFIKIMMPNLFY